MNKGEIKTSDKAIFIGLQGVILIIIVITAVSAITADLLEPVYSQTEDNIALLLQQTPLQGGIITPQAGVHHFKQNTEVTLIAIPKPGYQFVYWLGDVSDTTANRTAVYLNSPKIVIAVFERAEYEWLAKQELIQSAPGQHLIPSGGNYTRQGFSGGGGGPQKRQDYPPDNPKPKEPDFPVPPVPEPVTGLLLVLGSLYAFTGRQVKGRSK